MQRRLNYFVLSLLSVFLLTAFHGCLNEKAHQQTSALTAGKKIAYIDTRVGTGGPFWLSGNNTPAVQVPWGMVKLGPDTTTLGKMVNTSGYHYNDVDLKGFSHTRLLGTGVFEGGALRVLPSNSQLSFNGFNAYRPTFNHRNETAIAGLYSVTLDSIGIQADLTSTARVGAHRYTFTKTTNPYIYINLTSHLGAAGSVRSVAVNLVGGNTQITGSFTLINDFSNRYGGLTHYFDIRFPSAYSSYRFLSRTGESTTLPNSPEQPIYLELGFASTSNIEMRVGLSYVSIAGATANLDAEAGFGQTFDQLVDSNQTLWENLLGRITTVNAPDSTLKTFYTALYNSCRMPSLFGDYDAGSNENYTGLDKAAHTTTASHYYSDFSLWDTFRTVHPLYLLMARDEQADMLLSLQVMAQQSGRFPRWVSGTGHTDSMFGFPAAIMLTESYLKSSTAFDANASYTLLKTQATAGSGLGGTGCFDDYDSFGYCPSNKSQNSVSYTLEYAYADSALSALATALGHAADASSFSTRSKNYRNLWHSGHQAFIPKESSGNFMTDCRLDQLSYVATKDCSKHYAEGSAEQYRWYVPFDPATLISLFSTSAFSFLENFFAKAPPILATAVPNGYYWHGNEPDILSVVFFNHLDRPDRTQYWVDWIRRTKYGNNSVGLDGNDDGGTLSAWYVLTALGILPVPGTETYEIVSPAFDGATVDMGGGNHLQVTATGASSGKIYVTGAVLNAARLPTPRFTHSQISTGGTLELQMSSTPSSWIP